MVWGLGIGDWGLGDWGLGPIPNPQTPIPNPQSPIPNPQSPPSFSNGTIFYLYLNIKLFFIIKFI